MKLLFAYRYGNLGGVSSQLTNRLAGLAEHLDTQVHLAFSEDHGLSAELDYPHLLFDSPANIASYCQRMGIDVVSVIDTPEIIDAVCALPGRHKVLLEVHTTYVERLRYLEKLPDRIETIVVPSAYSASLVRQHLRREIPIVQVRNCIVGELFHPIEVPAQPRPICLWVGKLDDHKNWRSFLAIADALRREVPEIDFWMVGGSSASDDVKSELLAELYHRDLGGRVRWLSWVPHDSMPPLYAAASVSLVTSRDESFGMSVAESIMCGCPVVAADVGALGEIIDEPRALRLYPAGDDAAAIALVTEALATRPSANERRSWHQALAPTVSPAQAALAYRQLCSDALEAGS